MKASTNRRVIFQPKAYQAFQSGINKMVNVLRPTLGPLGRSVALTKSAGRDKMPEVLDNGGLIMRRIIALQDPDEDMGAMFLRHVLWHQYEQAGDGVATTALIFQSIFNQGIRYIVSGGNPMLLRKHLEKGMEVVIKALEQQAVPLAGEQKIAQVAESICYDTGLGRILGEVFDYIGEYGNLEFRDGQGRESRCEYVEGSYYSMGLFSPDMRKDYQNPRALAVDAAIFVSDLNFDETRQLVPLLDIVSQAGIKNLVIIANNLSDSNIGLLLYVSRKIAQFQVFAVKAPPPENGQAVILEDIATLTGAKPYLRVLSSGFDNFRLDDLGHARRSWADKEYFGIIAGQGSPQAIRAHLDLLKKRFAAETDLELRKKIRHRIGKLLSGGATIFIGGSSEIEIKARKEEAERTAEALRGALLKGVLPGGGAAFLDCIPLLHSLETQTNNEESKVAYRILRRALEEPTRTIIQNAGYDSNTWIELIEKEGSGFAFDARAGKAVHMAQAGILDSAGVVIDALYSAAASAALALTVDTLVHHKNPQISVNP